jgi:hypothetical protein
MPKELLDSVLLQQHVRKQEEIKRVPGRERNWKCKCGSGKKFKNCCLAAAIREARQSEQGTSGVADG